MAASGRSGLRDLTRRDYKLDATGGRSHKAGSAKLGTMSVKSAHSDRTGKRG